MATTSVESRSESAIQGLTWPVLLAAMLLPTVMACGYFVVLSDGRPNPWVQAGYTASKALLLLLPLLAARFLDGTWSRPAQPTSRGMLPALAFGLVVTAGMLALYFAVLRDHAVFSSTPERLRRKLVEFGLTSPVLFVVFACFVSLAHSLLEEYYWRWFVFGRLRRLLPLTVALLLAGLAFMGNHVVLLGVFFPGKFFTAALPLSLCVAVGGTVWAWLYDRYGSLYACWVGHAVIDASLFVIGYDLLFRG